MNINKMISGSWNTIYNEYTVSKGIKCFVITCKILTVYSVHLMLRISLLFESIELMLFQRVKSDDFDEDCTLEDYTTILCILSMSCQFCHLCMFWWPYLNGPVFSAQENQKNIMKVMKCSIRTTYVVCAVAV